MKPCFKCGVNPCASNCPVDAMYKPKFTKDTKRDNGEQIEAATKLWGLMPKFPFPSALSSTAKQMRQFEIAHEMNRRD